MVVPSSVRRISFRESQLRREQLRKRQHERDQARRNRLRRSQFHRELIEGFQSAALIIAIIGFFALIYWLAVSDQVPTAY